MKAIEQIISNVKATMGVEGLEITPDSEVLCRRVLNGEITGDEAIDIIKAKYKTSKVSYEETKEEIKDCGFEREETYF